MRILLVLMTWWWGKIAYYDNYLFEKQHIISLKKNKKKNYLQKKWNKKNYSRFRNLEDYILK